MRSSLLALTLVSLNLSLARAEEPLVEKYLHAGQLARGEQVLESALAAAPGDDQIRFGLAVLQLVRGVERLGQSLYEYGCLSDNTNTPFLRIPIPRNPDPSEVTFADFRRVLDAFRADLATVESTLADVKSKEVTLPLRLADIRLNLTGRGEASERFLEVLKKLMGPGFRPQGGNHEFLVRFDRGDIAWLRAYCHLLMGLIDLSLSFDAEASFDLNAEYQFARPKRRFAGTAEEKWKRQEMLSQVVKVTDPARLGHFRRHMLKVCELNRETWAFIRAERDDDHEWLPNPQQAGVLQIPVTNEMIEAWLSAVTEVEELLEGRKVIPAFVIEWLSRPTKKGFNLRKFFEDPPDEIDSTRFRRDGFREKYLDDTRPDVNIMAFMRVFQVLQNPLGVGYAVWFN